MLDEQGLGDFIDAHYQHKGDRLFRMERLPIYLVASDGGDWERWQAGASEPTWSRKQPWLDVLERDQRAGMVSQRVRLFPTEQLTDYELFACHMGYAHNSRFEDIRVLHAGEHSIPAGSIEHDYWLIEPAAGAGQVVAMVYDVEGRFLGAEVLVAAEFARYQRDSDVALAAAEPFRSWWDRHNELHRRMAA